jgi:hypothetical protein
MAQQRKNRDFGELRESAPTDEDFYRAVGEKMGRSRSTLGKRVAAIGVWVVVIAFMILTVAGAFQVNNNKNQNVELRSMMETQYNPSFKTRYSDLGKEIIDGWYNTNPSPAPVQLADGITWPHAGESDLTDDEASAAADPARYAPSITVRNVTFIGGRQEESPDTEGLFYEIDMYSAYVDGTLSNISVTFAIPSLDDYTSLPTLISEPSILPSTSANGEPIKSDVPSWRNVSATENLEAQLESWAEAYSTNNSGALKQITGDNSDSYYLGALSTKAWEYVENSVSVVWLKENDGNVNEAVGQVTWQMKLPDYTEPDPTRPNEVIERVGATQTQRMEILIQAPESGLPLIVAWGPVGTYQTLDSDTNKLNEEEFNNITSGVRSPATGSGSTGNGGSGSNSGTGDTGDTTDGGTTTGGSDSSEGEPMD